MKVGYEIKYDADLRPIRESTPPPEDGVTYSKLLKRCADCMKLRVHMLHDHPINIEDEISWLCALENVAEVRCAAGRIRYKDGSEKSYKTKYAVVVESDRDEDCPDYDPDE